MNNPSNMLFFVEIDGLQVLVCERWERMASGQLKITRTPVKTEAKKHAA